MDTSVLKNFAQESRRYLMDVVRKKVDYYLTSDNADIRAKKSLIDDLKKEITSTSKDQVVEKIAYTWFNRFCALRYMDVKQYSVVGTLTPASAEHTQPEILMEAKSGHIKDELGRKEARDQVIDLLSGKVASSDPQNDAYKLLLLMSCNYYHSIMPFLFEKVDDYTELLMPDDLLSEASIVSKVREALNTENCENVEVIGWLYQFYISEKKDEVFAGLKNNKKITAENIPAATQLFTPNWIVRYLVENSLGRLWILNRPNSNLISKMEYYIKPESVETDFLKIKGPEEIKICDPACGSGHMLVYAFDLLYLMYEEEGVDPNEIPSLILNNNLFGIEIDKRAGELAAFALTMKAREKQRRYFRSPVQPNICVLENIHFEANEIKEYMDHVGRDLFTEQFQNTLHQFEEAKNFGSLIKPELTDVDNILALLDKKNVSGHLLLSHTHAKALHLLNQVKFLSRKYHVMIANPPYMASKGMNDKLKDWLNHEYKDSKADLMSCFMERSRSLVNEDGIWGMINLPSWMFLSSFEVFRESFLKNVTILSFLHLGRGMFGSDFGSVAFIVTNKFKVGRIGNYRRLFKEHVSVRTPDEIKNLFFQNDYGVYRTNQENFLKIPGSPIAYWASQNIYKSFADLPSLESVGLVRQGASTSDNNRFLKFWFEVPFKKIGFNLDSLEAANQTNFKWFPYNKGGSYRKWYGNHEYVINYENDGFELKEFQNTLNQGWTVRLKSREYYFQSSVSWPKLTAGKFSCRYYPEGFIFDVAGCCYFPTDPKLKKDIVGLLNSKVGTKFLEFLSPTLNFEIEHIKKIPFQNGEARSLERVFEISKEDWDSNELSWEFKKPKLFNFLGEGLLEVVFRNYFDYALKTTSELRDLEIANNQYFISLYGMNGEIEPDVMNDEVTLFCNPYFRYGIDKTEEQIKELFGNDFVLEFISYSVGCIFGRYSIDKEGLILANPDQDLDYFNSSINSATFFPDSDNVVPVLNGDWFADDIVEKFKKFLKCTFGEKNFYQNIKFIELQLKRDINTYFAKDFYNDHVKMYKKRPIYWMFSSSNGTFNALIYMHRYTPDTVSIVLNGYLREFRTKLASKRENLERLSTDASASARDKTAAVKEIEQLKKMIVELDEYEKDILYPLATQRLEIDLDDGVKANYPKFGEALKPIKGLDKDED